MIRLIHYYFHEFQPTVMHDYKHYYINVLKGYSQCCTKHTWLVYKGLLTDSPASSYNGAF